MCLWYQTVRLDISVCGYYHIIHKYSWAVGNNTIVEVHEIVRDVDENFQVSIIWNPKNIRFLFKSQIITTYSKYSHLWIFVKLQSSRLIWRCSFRSTVAWQFSFHCEISHTDILNQSLLCAQNRLLCLLKSGMNRLLNPIPQALHFHISVIACAPGGPTRVIPNFRDKKFPRSKPIGSLPNPGQMKLKRPRL